jgi:hypothetical protein
MANDAAPRLHPPCPAVHPRGLTVAPNKLPSGAALRQTRPVNQAPANHPGGRQAKAASWAAYFLFVGLALAANWHDRLFRFDTPHAAGKAVVWALFLGFTAYTIYCSSRENLLAGFRVVLGRQWGRQVLADLYIGLLLPITIICLHSGSALVLLLWLAPILAFANLATLLYFAIHYDSLVARFAS